MEDAVRLPMVPVTPATRRKLELLLGELGLLATVASESGGVPSV
jgi:4-hydroxy-tetrahydrodipicolinate synthase